MYDLVESYGDEVVGGLPVPCVLEDEDGARLLLVGEPRLLQTTWRRARSGGAAGVLLATPSLAWMWAERVDEASEHRGWLVLPSASWRQLDDLPRVRDLIEPASSGGFVALHVHTEFSALDGLSRVGEVCQAAADDGQPGVAVTDHGTAAGHPALQREADKLGLRPVFGAEAYLCLDRHERDPETRHDYNHLVLWAKDQRGLHNLWGASTQANLEGFYYHPRMDYHTLAEFSEGLYASTACLRGPASRPLLAGDEERARLALGLLLDIFGDRLRVEVHTNQTPEQLLLNPRLVSLAHDFGVPLLAVTDSHYPTAEDRDHHRVWMAMQTNKDVQDETGMFEGDSLYHMHTEAEVRKALAYLGDDVVDEAISNTVELAESCTARVEGLKRTVVFSRKGGVEHDEQRLRVECEAYWGRRVTARRRTHPEQVYRDRMESEFELLVDKNYCGYYLLTADYVQHAKDKGILVGPSRGSGGGSVVAYLAGITEIDPVEAGLMFERFLTPGRDSPPDFDVDFPSSRLGEVQDYVVERWGERHVARVGTHLRMKNKGTVRKLAATLKSVMDIDYSDIEAVCAIIDEAEADSAGLGYSWEDVWTHHADQLDPYRDLYPAFFALADRFAGRLSTYGKHPAGFVIAPDDDVHSLLPLRLGSGDQPVTEFDMDALEELRLLKADLLLLRNLDTVQIALDLVGDSDLHPYNWTDQYDDPQMWAEVSAGHTLGMFQVETTAGTRMARRVKPTSLAELSDVVTLNRPGPLRSGLADTYIARRNGEEAVSYPHEVLEEVLRPTWGCFVYQEQVMAICSRLAGYTLGEADEVRRILGKKKVELVEAEGERFLSRCRDVGLVDRPTAEGLWEQMAEFSRYSFNKAHAWAYAMVGCWTQFFKVHHPVEFLTASLTTVADKDKNRIPEFVRESRRLGVAVLPPDINESGRGFSIAPGGIRYGLDSVKGVGPAGMDSLVEGQPYPDYRAFRDWIDDPECKANKGHVAALAAVGTFDSLYPNRQALEVELEREKDKLDKRCVHKDESASGPNNLPCVFDWESEPWPVGKSGRPLKERKPPPKRCTIRCRNYTPPPSFDPDTVEPYTEQQIRDREREILGVALTGSPFARIPDEDLASSVTDEDASDLEYGTYVVYGELVKVKPHTDRHNRKMGFVALECHDGSVLDATALSDAWDRYHRDLRLGRFAVVAVKKDSRGLKLTEFLPLD